MNDLPGEAHAIAVALNVARQYGYGNLISRLQSEWSDKLQEGSGLSKDAADAGAWKPTWFWGRIDELKDRNAKLEKVAAKAKQLRDKSRWHQLMGENRCVPDEAALTELFLALDELEDNDG